MPTAAEVAAVHKQCQELVNQNYPNMPRSWRRIMARKAANRWAADQRSATMIESPETVDPTPADDETVPASEQVTEEQPAATDAEIDAEGEPGN